MRRRTGRERKRRGAEPAGVFPTSRGPPCLSIASRAVGTGVSLAPRMAAASSSSTMPPAATAAIEVKRELRQQQWPAGEGAEVRIWRAHWNPDPHGDGDVGTDVHRAARISRPRAVALRRALIGAFHGPAPDHAGVGDRVQDSSLRRYTPTLLQSSPCGVVVTCGFVVDLPTSPRIPHDQRHTVSDSWTRPGSSLTSPRSCGRPLDPPP
jgi:hypothetical protein